MSVVVKQPTIAAFDFDGTLTRHESFFRFLWFSHKPAVFAWKALTCLPVLIRYACRRMSNDQAKAAVLRCFFAGCSVAALERVALDFAQKKIPATLRPEGLARLRHHQKQGHECVLVSATLALYLRPWAEHVGFSDVLATELAQHHGVLTGEMSTPNCYGEEKARRLRARYGVASIHSAYGDSDGDTAMLAMAKHPHLKPWR